MKQPRVLREPDQLLVGLASGIAMRIHIGQGQWRLHRFNVQLCLSVEICRLVSQGTSPARQLQRLW